MDPTSSQSSRVGDYFINSEVVPRLQDRESSRLTQKLLVAEKRLVSVFFLFGDFRIQQTQQLCFTRLPF